MNHLGVRDSEYDMLPRPDCLSLALMIEAIINGRMSFLYEQVILTNNHEILLESWLKPFR
jgi:hypothetical protein